MKIDTLAVSLFGVLERLDSVAVNYAAQSASGIAGVLQQP